MSGGVAVGVRHLPGVSLLSRAGRLGDGGITWNGASPGTNWTTTTAQNGTWGSQVELSRNLDSDGGPVGSQWARVPVSRRVAIGVLHFPRVSQLGRSSLLGDGGVTRNGASPGHGSHTGSLAVALRDMTSDGHHHRLQIGRPHRGGAGEGAGTAETVAGEAGAFRRWWHHECFASGGHQRGGECRRHVDALLG